jgi:hypothetical protein
LLKQEGVPFVPQAISKDVIFSGLVMLAFPAAPPTVRKDQSGCAGSHEIRRTAPDFFFWLYAVLPCCRIISKLSHPRAPIVGIALLFACRSSLARGRRVRDGRSPC